MMRILSEQKEAELVQLFEKAVKTRKSGRGLPRKYWGILERIFEFCESTQKLRGLLSRADIDDSILNISWRLKKPPKNITADEISDYVRKKILTTKNYHFYYPIYYMYNFPDDYQIGHCRTKHYNTIPQHVREALEFHWKHEFEINKELAWSFEDYMKNRKEALFLHTLVKVNGPFKAIDEAVEIVDSSLDVLRIVYRTDFYASEYCYTIEGINWAGTGNHRFSRIEHGAGTYSEVFDKEIREYNSAIAERKVKLDERLHKAIRIYGIATSVRYLDVKFILLCSGLEALMLTPSDKDYLGWKLAERVSFLISKRPSKREEIFELIRELYNKRSRFVHQDEKHEEGKITESDYKTMEGVLLSVIWKLIELKRKGYTHIQKDRSGKSVIDYIDKLKFS